MTECRRELFRMRSGGIFNPNSSRTSTLLTEVRADQILVIETISIAIRVPQSSPTPEVSRFSLTTGAASPEGTGSPLVDIPVTRMATDPAGDLVNFIALANMRVYATDGTLQYSIDLSKPSSGSFDVSVYGYLLPADSRSLAP